MELPEVSVMLNCRVYISNLRFSAMPEDAEEAAKKLNQKEFFGKVVKVEIAKPKKKGLIIWWIGWLIEKAVVAQANPEDTTPAKHELSEKKQEEKQARLHTIVIFGIQRGMKLETLSHKYC